MTLYKAIIFDLDGTAVPNAPDALPSKKLIEVIHVANKKIHLCPATGRPLTNAHYILKALSITDPCIVSAGTQIVNPRTKEVLWEATMSIADSKRVIEICTPYPYKVLLRDGLMDSAEKTSEINIVDAVNVIYIMQVTNADATLMLDAFSKINGITASPVSSWTDSCIDIHITDVRATKEHAVKELLKLLNVTKEETVGVGDGENDIHLFKSVGLKVAMGNASGSLKKAADVVIESVDDDGLAKFIEKYS